MAKTRVTQREETKAELPVVTAISIVKGADGWQVLTLKVQGDKVLSVDATPADMRAVALEAFRLRAVKEFME